MKRHAGRRLPRFYAISPKLGDIIIIAAVAAAAVIIAVMPSAFMSGGRAVVRQYGEAIFEADFDGIAKPVRYTVTEPFRLTVEISRAGAAVVESECPDQICVRTGRVKKNGACIACVPAGLTVTVEGERNETDAVTYS